MTEDEKRLLKWLGKEDYSQYGECHGDALELLVEKGYVQIHNPGEYQSFIANASHDEMYLSVSLTPAGLAALAALDFAGGHK